MTNEKKRAQRKERISIKSIFKLSIFKLTIEFERNQFLYLKKATKKLLTQD